MLAFCEKDTAPSSAQLQITEKTLPQKRKGSELEVDHEHVGVLVFSFILILFYKSNNVA